MLYDKNVVDMSLRLKRSDPIFRTKGELPSIGRRRRTRDDIRLGMNLPIDFMIVRQKRDQTYVFRILPALNLIFHLLTKYLEELSSITFLGAKPSNCLIATDKNNICRFPLISCILNNILKKHLLNIKISKLVIIYIY